MVDNESAPVDAVPKWFPGVSLNFAENMLFSRGRSPSSSPARCTTEDKEDAKIAVTEVREGASAVRSVSYGELRALVARLAGAMRAKGVEKGDRVVVVAANSVETLAVWLAAAWLGAVFSSSSTDMGVKGILQRAVQVNPKVGFLSSHPPLSVGGVVGRLISTTVVVGISGCLWTMRRCIMARWWI